MIDNWKAQAEQTSIAFYSIVENWVFHPQAQKNS